MLKRLTLEKPTLLALGIFLLAFVVFLGLLLNKPEPASQEDTETRWPVHVVALKQGTYQPNLWLYGRVESPKQVQLTAAVSADVHEALVREGDSVQQNIIIMQLDDRDARLLLQQREAEVNELEAKIAAEQSRFQADEKALVQAKALTALQQRRVDREAQLVARNVSSKSRLDDAKEALHQQTLALTTQELAVHDHENRLNQLQAQLARSKALATKAALDLARTTIRAPFDGIVTDVLAMPGERVREGDALIHLYDNHEVELRIHIPSHYVESAQQALAEQRTIEAEAQIFGKPVKLELARMSPQVDKGRGGVDGIFRIIGDAPALTLGHTVKLRVTLSAQNDLYWLPQRALYGMNKIYRIDGEGRLQGVEIVVAGDMQHDSLGNGILVKQDSLTPGDNILTTHIPHAVSGMAVRIIREGHETP